MTITVERVRAADWNVFRDLRLQALRDAPAAFWATWEEENRYGPTDWTGFIEAVAWFIASRAGRPIGLAGALSRTECPSQHQIVGMWVHATERGCGTADLLLHVASQWARDHGAAAVTLWVAHDNQRAQGLYRRHGFALTGEEAPRREGRTGREVRMRLDSADAIDGRRSGTA